MLIPVVSRSQAVLDEKVDRKVSEPCVGLLLCGKRCGEVEWGLSLSQKWPRFDRLVGLILLVSRLYVLSASVTSFLPSEGFGEFFYIVASVLRRAEVAVIWRWVNLII